MGTGNAMRPSDVGTAGEALPDRNAPTGHAPAGAARSPIPGLSPVSVTIVVLAVVGVVVGAVVHLAMCFLSLLPPNAFSQGHVVGVNKYVAPEFIQGWKVFAPNVPNQNTELQAHAKVLTPDGKLTDTGWVNLSTADQARIVHNPFPSHSEQNEIRLGWNYLLETHDAQGRPMGLIGNLTQQYVLRIAVQRLAPHADGGTVLLVQVRSATTPVAAPPWTKQHIDTRTRYLVQPWWVVRAEDSK